jgi:hypothetical protein
MPTDSKTWLRGVEVRKATLVKQGERPRASQVFGVPVTRHNFRWPWRLPYWSLHVSQHSSLTPLHHEFNLAGA